MGLSATWLNSMHSVLFFILFLSSADFFSSHLFTKKKICQENIRVSNKLDSDQAGHFFGLILVQTVSKGNQQTTLVDKEIP